MLSHHLRIVSKLAFQSFSEWKDLALSIKQHCVVVAGFNLHEIKLLSLERSVNLGYCIMSWELFIFLDFSELIQEDESVLCYLSGHADALNLLIQLFALFKVTSFSTLVTTRFVLFKSVPLNCIFLCHLFDVLAAFWRYFNTFFGVKFSLLLSH